MSSRSFRSAIEEALTSYTRLNLETVLAEELKLHWPTRTVIRTTTQCGASLCVRRSSVPVPRLSHAAQPYLHQSPEATALVDVYNPGETLNFSPSS